MLEDIISRSQLHHVAQVHDTNAVGNILDDRQVMGDEHIGEMLLLLQFQQEVNHLGLDGHVQSGNGLVTDHKFRPQSQRAGNANALPLAT